MARRLFHAIVLVGTSMGTACASRDAPIPSDARGETDLVEDTGASDGFVTIMTDSSMPSDSGSPVDSGTPTDSTTPVDTRMPDTFPGIMPPPTDTG